MSSTGFPVIGQISETEEKKLFNSSKSLFNSKLFISLEINDEEYYITDSLEKNDEEEVSDNSIEFEEANCLSNELIKDLDLLSSISNKKETENETNIRNNDNIIESLLSLAKDGYEFKPKNYNPEQNNNRIGKKYFVNYNTKNLYNNSFRDKKNDWFCSYCNNLNFSFRNKCNKCKISKENSKKHKYNILNRVI